MAEIWENLNHGVDVRTHYEQHQVQPSIIE